MVDLEEDGVGVSESEGGGLRCSVALVLFLIGVAGVLVSDPDVNSTTSSVGLAMLSLFLLSESLTWSRNSLGPFFLGFCLETNGSCRSSSLVALVTEVLKA